MRNGHTPHENRATNVPVSYAAGGKTRRATLDQRKPPAQPGGFATVAIVDVAAGEAVTVVISNDGTDGHVIADAVQLAAAK